MHKNLFRFSILVRTDIDLASPASATGSVTSVHVYWSSSGCTNVLKIKYDPNVQFAVALFGTV